MKKIKETYQRIPKWLRNKYAFTLLFFLIWMLFFDKNDVISQVQLYNQLNNMEEQKEYYHEKIKEVKKDRNDLLTNQETLEKFAREKYWMKRDNEDIFIIVEEEK